MKFSISQRVAGIAAAATRLPKPAVTAIALLRPENPLPVSIASS